MTTDTVIKVGIADLNVCAGCGVLKTTGLGSCVGVTLYDPVKRIGGMAHVMLPSSEIARGSVANPAKYADTAIPALFERMLQEGAVARRLVAKLAGGAQMFAYQATGETMRIGQRNVEMCKAVLERLDIPICAEDTGGNYGRTIELYCETGVLVVRSVQCGTKEL